MSAADATPANPLLVPSPLPYALPPFASITLEDCREALLAGMAEQRAEVAAIVGSTEPPTFDNTVVALERSGRLLVRAGSVFGNLGSSLSTPRLREIAGTTDLTVYSPESALGSAIMGAAPGATVTYQAPNGRDITVEVVAIEPFVP